MFDYGLYNMVWLVPPGYGIYGVYIYIYDMIQHSIRALLFSFVLLLGGLAVYGVYLISTQNSFFDPSPPPPPPRYFRDISENVGARPRGDTVLSSPPPVFLELPVDKTVVNCT